MFHTTRRGRLNIGFSRLSGSIAACGLLLFLCGRPAQAYSQFTHLELIDLLWDDAIRPVLLEQYPGTSEGAMITAQPMPTAEASYKTSATIHLARPFSAT